MILALCMIYPFLYSLYMDWIATLFFIIPLIIVFYRLSTAKTWIQTDYIPKWKQLVNYLRRDNEVVPLVGKRAYMGESFLDFKELGLMEFLGKDTVYTWGDKKVCWALENVNFTPDPRYFNFTALLYNLGFKDSDDVRNVLLGNDLYLMGKVYQNMITWDNNHGVNKLIADQINYNGDKVKFEPAPVSKIEAIHNKLDKIRSR